MVTSFVLRKGDDELVVVVDEPWEGAGAAVPHADAPLCPAARGPVLLQSHQLPGGPIVIWVIVIVGTYTLLFSLGRMCPL